MAQQTYSFLTELKPLPAFLKNKAMCFLNVFSTVFIYTLLSSRQKKASNRSEFTLVMTTVVFTVAGPPQRFYAFHVTFAPYISVVPLFYGQAHY